MSGRFFLLCSLLSLLALSPQAEAAKTGRSDTRPAKTTQALSEEETRISIRQLEESIQAQEERLEENAGREHGLLAELQRLDMAMDEQRRQLEDLQARQDEKQTLIEARAQELARLAGQHRQLQEHLMKRMRASYLMGKTGLFNALFASSSMGELVRSNEAFRSLVTYDREHLLRFRESMQEVERAKQALAREQDELAQLIAEAGEQQRQLQLAADRQKQFLDKVQTERSLHERAIQEMNRAQRELTDTLKRMADEERQRAVRAFTGNRGKLPPPIEGSIIRSFMEPGSGDEVDSAPFAHGITIGVDDEREVRAVYGGVVIYADYMPGYGKMVIIEHAQQYYTVTAKFAKILVGEKTRVAQGDLLGTTDTFATLIGTGLYFEVRHGSVAEDPTTWLKPGALSRAPKKTVLPPAGAGPEKPAGVPPAPLPDETPLVPIPNQNDNQEAPPVPPDKHAETTPEAE